jgi:hypothetical protein
MSEKKNIFRQANVDRMLSPEKLNDYIKVSRLSVWLVLAAILVLIIGAGIWAFTFELEPGLYPINFLLG